MILWRLVAIDRILEPSTQFPPSLSIPDIFCQTSRMKRLTATICVTIAVLLGSAGVSWSAEFKKGATTYQSGDYLTALREWKPLAEQGDVSAQFGLGVIYRWGKDVPQNFEAAVK